MSDQKSHQFRPPLYHRKPERDADQKAPGRGDVQKEQQGWDAYRKWLTHVSRKPSVQRSPVDHSIYSWKGYQNWADKVRQSWKPDDG
ncbi:MAG TPA: hypothetical protein VF329_02885 [Gammaproteobacteria bacterium]